MIATKHNNCPTCRCTDPIKGNQEVINIEWISTNDRFPEKNESDPLYVVWYQDDYEFAFYDGDCWDSPNCGFISLDHVSHWMPLPKAPE